MINFSIKDDVAIIELCNGKVNAFNSTTVDGVLAALKQAEKETKATVIKANGGIFSAGFDLKELQAPDPDTEYLGLKGMRLLYELYKHPLPLVSACNGHAIGLGAFILLVSDTVVGADGDYNVTLPETAVGLPFNALLVAILKAEMNQAFMNSAALQSQSIAGQSTIEAGFIDQLVPADELHTSALAAAQALMQLPANAYADNKNTLRNDVYLTMEKLLAEGL